MISRPFKSTNNQINELIDWIIRSFQTRANASRVVLQELNRLGYTIGVMNAGELRYRQYKDKYGDFIQLVLVKDNKFYPMPAVKANSGMLRLLEKATAYADISIGGGQAGQGASAPDLGAFLGSGGLEVLLFDGASTTEEIFFEIEMPRDYKEGSDIVAGVRWTPTDTGLGNVVWRLEYSWANLGDEFPSTTSIAATDTVSGTAWTHQHVNFDAIDGSGKLKSSLMVCRLYRNPTGADDYGSDAAFLKFDMHYETEGFGSDHAFIRES